MTPVNETIFKRKIYDRMLRWKAESEGKYALLIEGARRIGKSTISEEFARNEYDDYLIIDFANADERVVELFNSLSDINLFFLGLQTLTSKVLPIRKSVIIFDEVQFCPKARQAIKYLVKDGRYDYIETGSLISIKKNVKDILIPSEEMRIEMYPLDFEEFLWAVNKKPTYDLIRHSFENLSPMGDAMNRVILKDFRLYMLVGGMPQAINAYLATNDFTRVDNVKRAIIELYEADFRKIDIRGRASTIFMNIPSELSRNTVRYKVGSVIDGAKPSRMGEVFADLADSKTVNFAFHSNDPGVGLAFRADFDVFKLFMSDTGLFITQAFKDKYYAENEIYRKLWFDKLPTDLGYVFENVVAQLLVAAGHDLYYYTFRDKSDDTASPRSYEIDFLINQKDKISPIEVKSSGYKSHKSMDLFCQKYSARIKNRYILYTKDLRKEGEYIYLPVYMAGLL
ncbi:MAG: AAA family ATPase [Bacteroides sp.]|nr:AAA family ATPase [Bacteroides sp.]MCM1378564.1 AAA family ATPase [Bacteroides sp.]MCM1444865.1 AAA family ATPase [Prevotella sp.]